MEGITINFTPEQLTLFVKNLLTLRPGSVWERRTMLNRLSIHLSPDGQEYEVYNSIVEWIKLREEYNATPRNNAMLPIRSLSLPQVGREGTSPA